MKHLRILPRLSKVWMGLCAAPGWLPASAGLLWCKILELRAQTAGEKPCCQKKWVCRACRDKDGAEERGWEGTRQRGSWGGSWDKAQGSARDESPTGPTIPNCRSCPRSFYKTWDTHLIHTYKITNMHQASSFIREAFFFLHGCKMDIKNTLVLHYFPWNIFFF